MRVPVDRAILVGAPPRQAVDPALAENHLEELARLTDTAGGEVVGSLTQRITKPNPRVYLGEGKAAELKELVSDQEGDLVIFDEELTPAQGKNLEELLGVRVMDRSELILDIFATRARSSEARMQVELAQLEYLLPRLRRMWIHLSRIRGGIGLRGPGETQLETDRRLIRKRISTLRSKLRQVAKAREVRRQHREGIFQAVLVGYTNAGKSSLLSSLSGSDLFIEDRLFATLDSATRSVDLGQGYQALITDTVGFIRKLPHHLVASFHSTLEEAKEANVLLHVIDASRQDWEDQHDVVMGVLSELGLAKTSKVLVFNKVDLITPAEEEALRRRIRAIEPTPAVFVSAKDENTLLALKETLGARVRAKLVEIVAHIPVSNGRMISRIYEEAEIVNRVDENMTVSIRARVSPAFLGRLKGCADIHVE
ncbi:MAG: GTPase HflX [Gemmatimonadota bacterium]|nr:GTPase HflX [Gemmatimonadota bacterium]MEC9317918.1 GTPase HflX [Gemmatimonadota bacterium]